MKRLTLVGLLSLGACNAGNIDVSAITATPAEVQATCTGITIGYLVWEAEWARKVKPATLTKIRAGYSAIGSICANPPASKPEVLGSILKAVQTYTRELEQATQ